MTDDYKIAEDRLLAYFKTIPNNKIIINLYLSYMNAIEFIQIVELENEYIEFSKIKEMQNKNTNPMEQYLEHLEYNTNWDDTEH